MGLFDGVNTAQGRSEEICCVTKLLCDLREVISLSLLSSSLKEGRMEVTFQFLL